VAAHRLRVCYGKTGPLRFLGHLEVCAALERAVRRARLPVAFGQGFHPKAKLAFGPALPVGVAGLHEYVDVTMTQFVPADQAAAALAAAMPSDMPLVGAAFARHDTPSLTKDCSAVVYRVQLVSDGDDPEPVRLDESEVKEGAARLIARGHLEVERRGRLKRYELASALLRAPRLVDTQDGPAIEAWLAMIDQAPIPPDILVGELLCGAYEGGFMRVTRVECYARREDTLIPLGEVP
jgi:radical SAM-linked protein